MPKDQYTEIANEYLEKIQEATYKDIREALLLILRWECPEKSQTVLNSLDDAVFNNVFQ